MKRSSRWAVPLTFALLFAIAGSFVGPAQTGQARGVAAPAATRAKQIVYLDAAGQIIVDSFVGNQPLTLWKSGLTAQGLGWSNVAVGDFNGDGKKEIAATRHNPICPCDELQMFSPVGASFTPYVRLDAGQYHLMAVGDFENLGYDQLVASYTYTSGSYAYEAIIEYAWDRNGEPLHSPITVNTILGGISAMAAGDVNRDNFADLVFTGKGDTNRLLMIKLGSSQLPLTTEGFKETDYCCQWWAVKVGNMDKDNNDTDHPGNEIVLSRDASPPLHSVDLEYYKGKQNLSNWDETLEYSFAPSFGKLALGDVDGDPSRDDEILALRNPGNADQAYLVLLNPAGPDIRQFEQNGDYGTNAWRQVAAGDVNGDPNGLADVVILRSTGYRVYTSVASSDNYVDVPAPTSLLTTALVVDDLGLSLSIAPTSVYLIYAPGNTARQSATIQVDGPPTATWSATTSANWVLLNGVQGPAQGNTPGSFTVSLNPGNLPGGNTSGTVQVTVTGPGGYGLQRPVTINFLRWTGLSQNMLPITNK